MRNAEVHGRDLEHRPGAQQLHMDSGGKSAGDHQRDKRPRLEFKQQQFDGQNHAGDRRVEGRRHARRRAAGQQNFALGSGGMKRLSDQRADGAAGLDDWAFRAERAAGADGDGRGNRFQDRHSRLDAAAIDQYRFHSFGNAVALDLRGPILRHEADDNSADDRDENYP